MTSLPKILLVEDDRDFARALVSTLRSNYIVDVATTGKLGLYKTDTDNYTVILLDVNLPDISGLAVCQQLRERGIQAPILILSGESNVLTKVNLLDAGANDYLTKPITVGELLARLRVLTRFNQPNVWPAANLEVYDVVLDRRTYIVTRAGINLNLRRKEFELLECLMENVGYVVTRKQLLARVWKNADDLWTNTLDVHIKYLRDKLDKPFGISFIKTVHGRGYKLEASPTTSKRETVVKS